MNGDQNTQLECALFATRTNWKGNYEKSERERGKKRYNLDYLNAIVRRKRIFPLPSTVECWNIACVCALTAAGSRLDGVRWWIYCFSSIATEIPLSVPIQHALYAPLNIAWLSTITTKYPKKDFHSNEKLPFDRLSVSVIDMANTRRQKEMIKIRNCIRFISTQTKIFEIRSEFHALSSHPDLDVTSVEGPDDNNRRIHEKLEYELQLIVQHGPRQSICPRKNATPSRIHCAADSPAYSHQLYLAFVPNRKWTPAPLIYFVSNRIFFSFFVFRFLLICDFIQSPDRSWHQPHRLRRAALKLNTLRYLCDKENPVVSCIGPVRSPAVGCILFFFVEYIRTHRHQVAWVVCVCARVYHRTHKW